MGRSPLYEDEKLTEAVIKYSEYNKTAILPTRLAEWARKNIVGLENVQAYHFTRPVKNKKTGRDEKKLCTQRIEEINFSRDIRKRENKNILLSSVSIDTFYEQSERRQRKEIADAKEIVIELTRKNRYLKRRADFLDGLLKDCNVKIEELEKRIKKIELQQKTIDKTINTLKKYEEDEQLKAKFEEIGLIDGEFDLLKYNDSLRLDIKEMLNINKVIRNYQRNMSEDFDEDCDQDEIIEQKNYIDDLTDF